MPAETHELGRGTDPADVEALLWMLLGDPDADDSTATRRTLAELGVDAAGMADLWAAVCEEFGERSLGPEIDPGALDTNVTVAAAARTMAGRLARDDDDR